MTSRAFLTYGFRPFFLLGPAFGVLAVGYWAAATAGVVGTVPFADPLAWHAHEMLYGFVIAAIAGFLLTAIASFTGRAPVRGRHLGVLVALWIAGRIAMAIPGPPGGLIAAVDVAFPIALAATIARELILAGNRRNYPLAAVVGVLALADLGFHLARLGLAPGPALAWLLGVVHLVSFLVTVIGGRIIPAFTANWLRARAVATLPRTRVMVERAAIALVALTAIADLAGLPGAVVVPFALAAAAAHAVRLAGWRGWLTASNPLLAILHVGYAWLVVAYLALAWTHASAEAPRSIALHAMAVGVFGTMILAVTTRVALGHTGRTLRAAAPTVAAYVLVVGAGILRMSAPLFPSAYPALLLASAIAWASAFGLYLVVYAPILIGPRLEPAEA